jgi:cell division protease FtsH
VYEPVDHSRTLCIISGNLDEAFSMAGAAGEADVDADIFSAYTAKITVVDVKNALLRRFRPEQVARFGNIHLIYRSLRRRDFEALIAKEIGRVVSRAEQLTGVSVSVDESVHRLIYRNGVFPVQGVRPVFSSVIDILETNLTGFLFEAVMGKHRSVAVRYDEGRSELVARIGSTTARLAYTGRIDTIRQGNQADVVANVAAHEAGHAVAYSVLFGLAPLQLTAKVASSYAAGFTFPHQIHESLDHLVARAKVLLAGGLAEDLLFGKGNATVGRLSDRESVTVIVTDIIRRYGFDAEFQANYSLDNPHYLDRQTTDTDIEKMIARLVGETRELLRDHQAYVIDLADRLQRAGALGGSDVAAIAERHGVQAVVKPEGHLHVAAYDDLLPRGQAATRNRRR